MKKDEGINRRSLSEILDSLRITDLKDLLAHLSLKIKSGLRKAVMVRAIEKWLVEHPQDLLDHMLTYELRMYDDIVNHPGKKTRIPFALTQYPIGDMAFTSDGVTHYIAP